MRRFLLGQSSLLCAFAACFVASSAAAGVIVSENFGGTGSALNLTMADAFDGGITTAGGSSTWMAGSSFLDNGTTTANTQSAFLDMGTYINDAKGTEFGLFTMSATISPTNGGWLAFGFFNGSADTESHFAEGGGRGQGMLIYRASGELDGFAGPGAANNVDGDVVSGDQLLSIVLDLTTHDGVTDFGTISFFDGVVDPGNLIGSHAYTSDQSFEYAGLSNNNNSSGAFSNFLLEQPTAAVPEPGSLALMSLCGLFACLTYRVISRRKEAARR